MRAWVDEHHGEDPDPRTIADLERRAVLASRPAKTHGVDAPALHQHWADQAAGIGFDRATLTFDRLPFAPPAVHLSDDEIVSEALRRVEEESATWLRADLVRHIATLLPPDAAAGASELIARIDAVATAAEARCTGLGPERGAGIPCRRDGRPVSEAVTDRRLTTRNVLDQETDLRDWIARNTTTHPSTDDPQQAAIDAMASQERAVLVVGPAGTGKTTATARAVERLRAQRRPVVALAPSGKAADVLDTEAGCRAETLAAFLTRHQRTDRTHCPAGTTVVVDEAGMATTEDLHQLKGLAQQHHWRLVAIGDPAQLPPVGRGGDFAHWTEHLPAHHLDTPRRFTEPWEAEASLALRRGDPDAAQTYADHNRLDTLHPALVATRAADLHARHATRGEMVRITTNTAETARQINREIQRRLHRWRRLRDPVHLGDGTKACTGDTIATRRNNPDLRTDTGERIRNRHTWTVDATHPDGSLTVTNPERGSVTLPAAYVARHAELGWAVTGYGAQGDTTDIGIAVLEPGTTRNHAYVALTRGRHENLALLPEPTGTANPADRLAQMIEPPPRHRSALSAREHLHREAGVPIEQPAIPSLEPDQVAKVQARLDRAETAQRGHGRGIGD